MGDAADMGDEPDGWTASNWDEPDSSGDLDDWDDLDDLDDLDDWDVEANTGPWWLEASGVSDAAPVHSALSNELRRLGVLPAIGTDDAPGDSAEDPPAELLIDYLASADMTDDLVDVIATSFELHNKAGRPSIQLGDSSVSGDDTALLSPMVVSAVRVAGQQSVEVSPSLNPQVSYDLCWALLVSFHAAVAAAPLIGADDTMQRCLIFLEPISEELHIAMFRRFNPLKNGNFRLRLSRGERALLVDRCDRLREVVLSLDGDGGQRLRPPAYGTDSKLSAEWARMCGDDLMLARLDALDTMEKCLGNKTVSEAELSSLMKSINSMRLVLGVLLDVDEESDGDASINGPDDPNYENLLVYRYLGSLLYDVVSALSSRL